MKFEKENGYMHVLTWFYLVSKICAFAKPTSKSLLINRKISPKCVKFMIIAANFNSRQAPSTSNFCWLQNLLGRLLVYNKQNTWEMICWKTGGQTQEYKFRKDTHTHIWVTSLMSSLQEQHAGRRQPTPQVFKVFVVSMCKYTHLHCIFCSYWLAK
jgi:hypothetical protein